MDNDTVHRFRFTTDYGEVYAVAVLDDRSVISESEWKVGFAFCSPQDRCMVRREKTRIGYDLAEERVRNGHVGVLLYESVVGVERSELQEEIVRHVLRVIDWKIRGIPIRGMGLKIYHGRDESNFKRWITGKFAEQFRERYVVSDDN